MVWDGNDGLSDSSLFVCSCFFLTIDLIFSPVNEDGATRVRGGRRQRWEVGAIEGEGINGE